MLWCSRKVAVDMSAVFAGFAGAGVKACGAIDGGEAVQAASIKASIAAAANAPACASRSRPVPMVPVVVTASHPSVCTRFVSRSLAIGDFNLLRPRRLDPGAAALLDPAADPDAPSGEGLRFETRCRKVTRVSLQD